MTSASGTMGKLSPEQLDALLRETIVARLGTVTPDGYPYVVPIWTEYDGESIWLIPRAKAQYMQNMLLNPKISLSIAKEDYAGTRALVQGRAEVVQGPGPLRGRMLEIARSMGKRYEGEQGETYIQESLEWPRYLIRVIAEKIITWGDPGWHEKYK